MSKLPISVKLNFPIKMHNTAGEITETIDKLEISRRPKAKDFKGISMSSMQFDDVIKLISRMCNVPLTTAENLDTIDFMKVQEIIMDFLPKTGK